MEKGRGVVMKEKFKIVDVLEIVTICALIIGITSYYRDKNNFSIALICLGIIFSIIRMAIARDFKKQTKSIFFIFCASFVVVIFLGLIETTTVALANISGNKIDSSTWMNFIGAAIGTGGAVAGAFYTTKMQIDASKKQIAEEEEQKSRANMRAIARFLKHELRFNYNLIGLCEDMHIGTDDFRDIAIDEYEKVKYKLLDHQSEVINDIHEIYNLLYEMKVSKRVIGSEQQSVMITRIIELKHRLDQSFINIEREI